MKYSVRALGVGAFIVIASGTVAGALPRYGPLELSGNISAEESIRTPDVDVYAPVQQRNTFRLRLDYSMIGSGQTNMPPQPSVLQSLAKISVPGIREARLFLLYRAVYDSVYDYEPGFEQNDIYGEKIGLRLKDIAGHKSYYENRLREAYVDVKLQRLPLSFRLGRQQIVWGETDNFRLLDRVNALDLTWHLQQESWDELRIPYWMIKGLWDIDRLGPLSSAFVEFYWNPGDWYPAKRDFLPHPWSAPILNPITNPRTGNNLLTILGADQLYHRTALFSQGDYARTPQDNSQVGVRFSAVTPQGVQFTLNYFYQRWAGDDGTNAASIQAITNTKDGLAALQRHELPVEFIAPYVHAAGFSLNYAEEEYTQAVFRMESIYEFGVPFTDAAKNIPVKSPFATFADDLYGVSRRDMWKGMLAFDRPTWIRSLNRKATFLILGQFFWHHLLDNPDIRICRDFPSDPACTGRDPNFQFQGFRGTFSTSGLGPFGNPNRPFYDHVRDWEVLTTLAMTTFYRGGKIVPLLVYVLDPVNSYNMEVIWNVDYFITNDLIAGFSQRYFINTTERPVFETWGVAGLNRGRSETELRLTYQF